MSQLIEISQPPPSANPFTAAITGIGNVSIILNTSFPFLPNASPSAFVSVLISPISAPATNDFSPAPVKIRQRISDKSTLLNVASSSSRTWLFKAFNALGLLIVIKPTCPSVSYVTNSISIVSFYILHNNNCHPCQGMAVII